MAVLVGHLEGLFQSWADCTRHTLIPTRREPTKSGLIGLFCVATGRSFKDDAFVASVAECEIAFRTDREGTIRQDYHTVRDVVRADRTPDREGNVIVSVREYLESAVFRFAVRGSIDLLREIEQGLLLPAGAVSLGKKACVPSRPLWLPGGLVTTDETARQVLERWPWKPIFPAPEQLRLTLDLGVGAAEGDLRHDFPLSLDPDNRRFCDRRVATVWVATKDLPVEGAEKEAAKPAEVSA